MVEAAKLKPHRQRRRARLATHFDRSGHHATRTFCKVVQPRREIAVFDGAIVGVRELHQLVEQRPRLHQGLADEAQSFARLVVTAERMQRHVPEHHLERIAQLVTHEARKIADGVHAKRVAQQLLAMPQRARGLELLHLMASARLQRSDQHLVQQHAGQRGRKRQRHQADRVEPHLRLHAGRDGLAAERRRSERERRHER